MHIPKHKVRTTDPVAWSLALLLLTSPTWAQQAATPTPTESAEGAEEVVVLSPFEVTAEESSGYMATTSLAGTRINTQLQDVGSAISVVTSEFLKDTGATDNRTLLQYTTNTEVGSLGGNFVSAGSGNQQEEGTFTTPNTNTRVRGLTAADNTRNFFLTSIPWNGYNVDRVDMQRGPNSILFGMGSPAGIINTSTKTAQFRNSGEVELRYGSYGTNREMVDINQVILPRELAVRVAAVREDTQFRQRPAYSLDERIFGTLRYEPELLNRGSIKTSLKANYESGSIRSNNPRVITPIDFITPWFDQMNKAVYSPHDIWDNNPRYTYNADGTETLTFPENMGQAQSARTDGGGQNPYFQPWLGNFGSSYGGLMSFYNPGSTALQDLQLSEWQNWGGINSSGALDGNIGGFASQYRRMTINGTSAYAQRPGVTLPYSRFGLYKNATLTDSSIFDFYNNLLDGDNKSEWQNFHNFQVTLNQTFFNQKLGYEIAYSQQRFRRGQWSFLTDQRAGIFVDINTVNQDGTPNPNLGKPLITDAGIYGNGIFDETREASRLNIFADHNFNEGGNNGWFKKLLGRHTLSGLYSRERELTDSRDYMRWGTDAAYTALVAANPAAIPITDNRRVVEPVVYLSDTSLLGASTYKGLHIPRAGDAIAIPYTEEMRYFNSTWRPIDGNTPSTPWINSRTGQQSFQAENPANYVGFQNVPVHILSAERGDYDALARNAALSRVVTESKAAVWQAYFWDGAVVGMYGIRNDRVKTWARSGPKAADQSIDFNARNADGRLAYQAYGNPATRADENSPSWSVVAKLNKFIGDRLPVDINFYYSKSQNFRVGGTRYSIFGDELPFQSGTTLDRGIMIATRDNKYSLKINKYESKVMDANSTSGLNYWLIGNNGDTLFTRGENAADVYEYRLGTRGDPSTAGQNPSSWTYVPLPGQTQAQADAMRDAAVKAWREFTANPVIKKATTALGYSDFSVTQPTTLRQLPGLSITEDQVSRGYEIEFTANPTSNWRITANASKAEAIRNNVTGTAFQEYVNAINTAMNGPAGDLRIWGGGDTANTMLADWNGTFYSNYALARLGEGTVAPELRKWRFNLVTSYDFRNGMLKGFNVGAGYRWQDKIAIGYKPVDTDNPAIITYDLANPYYGPTEDAVDLWVGYQRRLTSKIDWQIQLNVRDAFSGNGLIPLTTQPDGSVAAWRIAPSRTWHLTSTFRF